MCVGYVTPEAAVGGPLALVRTGDRVRIDAEARRMDVLVDETELRVRQVEWPEQLMVNEIIVVQSRKATRCTEGAQHHS